MRKWVKLYTKILMDPEMHNLSDATFRTCVNLFALGGLLDTDGELGTLAALAYHLRLPVETIAEQLAELEKFQIVREKKGVWSLRSWDKLQAKPASADPEAVYSRVKKHRENKPKAAPPPPLSNESVTTLQSKRNEPVTESNAPRLDKNRVEIDKSIKSVAAEKPPRHPALTVYQSAAKTNPDRSQNDTIIATIGERPADLDFWGEVVTAYCLLGWNKRNVANMLEYFQRHELPATNKPSRNGNGVSAVGQMLAYAEELKRGDDRRS